MIGWLKKWFKHTKNNQITTVDNNQIEGNHNFVGVENNRSVTLENSHVGIIITGDHVTVQCEGLPPEVLAILQADLQKLLSEFTRTQKHLNDALDFKESKLEQLQKEAEDWINRYNSLSKDLENLRRENPDYAEILTKAEAFLKQGKFSEVTALLEPLKAKGDEKTQQNAKVHFILGQAYLLDNKPIQALPEYEAAYHQDFKNSEYGFQYALLLQKQNEYKKAQRLYEGLLDELKQLPEPEQQAQQKTLLAVMYNLALVYTDTQELEKATKLYYEASKIRRELDQSNPQVFPFDISGILNNMANLIASDPKRRKEAEQGYQEILKVNRKLAQNNPQVFLPDVAQTLNNLAILVAKDPLRREEAEQGYREALEIYREFAQNNPQVFCPKVAMMLNNLAKLYLIANNPEKKAMPLIEEAISIGQSLFTKTPSVFGDDLAYSLAIKGLIYVREGQTSEARMMLNEALQTAQTDGMKEAIKSNLAKLEGYRVE